MVSESTTRVRLVIAAEGYYSKTLNEKVDLTFGSRPDIRSAVLPDSFEA
jgi:hypothetical protein